MTAKPTPKDDAGKILAGIAQWHKTRDAIAQKVAAEIEAVRGRHDENLKKAEVTITALEKALEKLVQQYEAEIMDGGDRAELPQGSILCKKEKRVKRIKGMLAKLKKAKLVSAIKVPKEYVNWDVVEKFNDGQLQKLGTERVEKTLISYELKSQ